MNLSGDEFFTRPARSGNQDVGRVGGYSLNIRAQPNGGLRLANDGGDSR
jgi:hypothetical protein